MVEFALAIPIVLILILGIIEGGRLLFIYASVASASREAARYGAAMGDNGSGVARYEDCSGIQAAAERIGTFAGIATPIIKFDHGPGSGAPFSYCAPKPAGVSASALVITSSDISIQLGDRVIVEVSAVYTPIVPMVGIPSFTISSKDSRTILKEVYISGTQPVSP